MCMSKIKVLVADDSEIVRNGYVMLFAKSSSIEICGMAHSGNEAIKMNNELNPDIILLDVVMPGKDGINTCKEIVYHNENAKVMLNTALVKDDTVKRVMTSGAKALLLKEADHTELETAITTVHNGGEYYNKQVLDIMIKKLLATNQDSLKKYWSNQFSEREISIIQLTSFGFTSTEIGKKLNLSKRSIEVSRGAILHKMNVKNIIEMIIHAYKMGLLDINAQYMEVA